MKQSRILNHLASLPYFHGRRLIYNTLARIIPHDAVRSNYGVLLAKNPGDVTYRFAVLGKYGDFLQKIIAALPEDGSFVDIGANQGVFTLIAAKHLRHGQVFAFEPNPEIYRLLEKNITLNQIENTTTYCAAISDGDRDTIELTFDPAHSGAASLTGGQGKKVPVRAENRDLLNQFADERSGEILVKVDVEGAEKPVLTELFASRLGRETAGLVIELSQEYHSSAEIAALDDMIRGAGFQELSRRGKESHYDAPLPAHFLVQHPPIPNRPPRRCFPR